MKCWCCWRLAFSSAHLGSERACRTSSVRVWRTSSCSMTGRWLGRRLQSRTTCGVKRTRRLSWNIEKDSHVDIYYIKMKMFINILKYTHLPPMRARRDEGITPRHMPWLAGQTIVTTINRQI